MSLFSKQNASVPSKVSIVVVEDSPEIADMIMIALSAFGIRAVHSDDGVEGLELVKTYRPRVALLDIQLPHMNGYEICTAIQSDPALHSTHIVMMSGLLDDASEQATQDWRRRLNIADFIAKPFDARQLMERVQPLLAPETNV